MSDGRPLWIPARIRTSTPSGHGPFAIARCTSTAAVSAATACSNTAKNSSPRASTSWPPALRTADLEHAAHRRRE